MSSPAAPDGAAQRRSWPDAAQAFLTRIVAVVVSLLVAVEIMVLLVGVVTRYFHMPLVWSDELASILFLWLAMLGTVLAFQRDGHMRMTALLNKQAPAVRARFELFARAASLAFAAILGWPAVAYALDEIIITTPALGISNAWRAFALPIGVGLLGVSALLKIHSGGIGKTGWAGLAVAAVAIGAALCMGPKMRGLGNLNLLLFFVLGVGAMVLTGVSIAFSFGLATIGYLAMATTVPMTVMVGRMDEGMSHLILLAVPLFVFLGLLLEMTGMARAMVRFLASLLGHVRGGLS
ncbi:MAG: TRAP transporter small permease subunit, partial [Burkholderiaceae bacterium]|nr:TRAP transporter small permease subunit [Burkholderiaceae bacterium]